MKNKSLLEDALTHPSFARSKFEMLEFLGDKVLALGIANMLWMPNNEKEYSRKLVSLTNRDALIEVAKLLEVEKYVKWKGVDAHRDTILVDACEAVIGAIFLDLGFEEAMNFIQKYWSKLKFVDFYEIDPKSIFQIWANKRHVDFEYSLVNEEGSPHDKSYTVKLEVEGYEKVFGFGKSLKIAEKDAAKKFIKEYIR